MKNTFTYLSAFLFLFAIGNVFSQEVITAPFAEKTLLVIESNYADVNLIAATRTRDPTSSNLDAQVVQRNNFKFKNKNIAGCGSCHGDKENYWHPD